MPKTPKTSKHEEPIDIQSELFDRTILIGPALSVATLVHYDNIGRSLPDGWEDLFSDDRFPELAKKHFGVTIGDEMEYREIFDKLGAALRRTTKLGYFLNYRLPVIDSVSKHGCSHSGLGVTYGPWIYVEQVDDAALRAVLVDAEANHKAQIKKLKAKAKKSGEKKK